MAPTPVKTHASSEPAPFVTLTPANADGSVNTPGPDHVPDHQGHGHEQSQAAESPRSTSRRDAGRSLRRLHLPHPFRARETDPPSGYVRLNVRHWAAGPAACGTTGRPLHPPRYAGSMRIAFVSTWPSRRCGIATFTSDLIEAVHAADESVVCEVAAIDERNSVRAYGPEVRWRIRQGSPDGSVAAARAIGGSDADVVCVQHEFGLYGLWKDEAWEGDAWIEGTYIDHLTPFLQEVGKPVVVAMHTVLPEPSDAVRDAVRSISANADHLIVMAETAVDILREVYGVTTPTTVIQHGMPHIEPRGRRN